MLVFFVTYSKQILLSIAPYMQLFIMQKKQDIFIHIVIVQYIV